MMRVELTIPSGWHEVTLQQLRILAEHSLLEMPREASEVSLLCKLAGLTMLPSPGKDGAALNGVMKFRDENGVEFGLEDWQLADFCKRLAWYYDDMPCDVVCPVEIDAHLLATSFGDYFHADALMFGYASTGDVGLVKKALADLGVQQDVSDIDAVMVLIWWRGLKQWLSGEYPDVFAGSKDGGDGSYSPLAARRNIMLMLNGGHPQDNDAIERANMHDVLAALQHQVETAKKEEEMMRRCKP